MDKPEVVKILDTQKEAKEIKTVRLDKELSAKAGQFVMLWIPGIGEKPFSMSRIDGKIEITFDVKGKFTKALSNMKKGDSIGVRGPYGNGWNLEGKKNICIVAGGLGLAPSMPVIESEECTLIYGTRNVGYIKFKKRIEKACKKVIYTTDDGSFGKQCYACDVLEGVLKGGEFDLVLTCGPEVLMKRVVDICLKNGIECQASLERFMKCGIGVCGSCVIDPSGMRVCKDGPVFTARQLENSEFGEYRRDKSGRKIF
jgi:dihydroorotate dehydrogenase electron transfer subunit